MSSAKPAERPDAAGTQPFAVPDPAAFVLNMLQAAAIAQRIVAGIVTWRRRSGLPLTGRDDLRHINRAFLDILSGYVRQPARAIEAYTSLWQSYFDLWQSAGRRLMGGAPDPVAIPARSDKRFRDPSWQENLAFDMLKQVYLLTSRWLVQQVEQADDVDPHTRKKAEFYVRQMADAFSPSNFLLTNPEVLRTTLETSGENLVIGLQQLYEDLERGEGRLEIQQTDMTAFRLGENIATTPGKIVFQNDLMQLIQYEPKTKQVYKRPLVIFPPWINKYYILDLTSQKSFVNYCLTKGYTVFVASWVNPDAKLAMKKFEDYMVEGVYGALDAIEKATGEREVNAIGYCIGGTLLGATLAHMAAAGDGRIKSATFFAAQMDFSEAGELKVFIDDEQLNALEKQMSKTGGYLKGSTMARTFNMLRSNDLIWSYVVNNYLLGRGPKPFDLLYWNADATRMPAKMHVFYLRECYLNNNLARGEMVLGGERLDLSRVGIPIYLQSSREDHIAPYRSVYKATGLFSGPVRYILAGSGHIAGVINPPEAKKYQYWINPKKALPDSVDDWLAGAEEHPGSWWPDWEAWLRRKSGKKVAARVPGDGGLDVLEDAPGSYVMVKADS